MKILACFFALAAALAPAQDSNIAGPVAGFVYDSQTRDLRPMLGVPGAAYLGVPLATGLDAAAVSPDGTAALAVSDGRLLLISALRSLAPETVEVEGAIGGADRLAWSPDGALAVIYSSAAGQAQILRAAGRAPAPGPVISIDGALTALGVSAAGDLVAATNDGVRLVSEGQTQPLASGIRAVALAFRGSDLFLADAEGRILSIENFAAAPVITTFAEGLDSPAGLQVSADGRRLFVASSGTKSLTVFDVAERAPRARLDLDCTPSELRPFGARDLWLLNSGGSSGDPLYMVSGDTDPSAWFVPAGREL